MGDKQQIAKSFVTWKFLIVKRDLVKQDGNF